MPDPKTYSCATWDQVRAALANATKHIGLRKGEEPWFRGACSSSFELLPTLFWRARDWKNKVMDAFESDLFFEFQARARELHERNLSDWDCLFFMRHHGAPTRILDWTDSFGMATYFAMDGEDPTTAGATRCVWVLNPYGLNEKTWTDDRDLVQPARLGDVKGYEEPWDFGDLLRGSGPWLHDGPVAIYPLQISERMRAQRGWFTIFGNSRKPLEAQYPRLLARIDFKPAVIPATREFLAMAGLRPYSVYPDLDHLAREVMDSNLPVQVTQSPRASRSAKHDVDQRRKAKGTRKRTVQ
jgi:hypothetical protein